MFTITKQSNKNTTGKKVKKWAKSIPFFLLISSLSITINATPVRADYEKAPVLQAKSILSAELLKSKNHTVKNQVKNNGLFNHYTVESKFGSFQAGCTKDLRILVNEISAIAAMKEIASEDVAMDSLKQSGENIVTGAKSLINDPKGTFDGAVSGVNSLFNRGKKTIGNRKTTEAEDNQLEQLVGISKSKGEIATKYGVNVYSRNKALQTELDRLGRADFLGGLGTTVASSFVPGVGGLFLSASGTARLLNEAINTTPASELWVQNQKKLQSMGMDADTVKLFLNNGSFSPAMSTVMVAALEKMKGVNNRELFIKVALQASDYDMANTITKIVVMTAGYHQQVKSLQGVTPLARLTRGVRKDGTTIILLPTDYLTWNKNVADAVTSLSGEGEGKTIELWVLGTVSKQATAELQKLGWKIHTQVAAQLLPGLKK